MLLNHPVSLVAIPQVTTKAANGEVTVSIHGFELVDISKLAGGDERHSQSIDGGQGVSQHSIRETY